MNASNNNSLPLRCFKLPLPKPINGAFSSFKSYEINNGNPTKPQFSISSSLNVIPCQQTLNMHPIGKPLPNKRGRKPLTTMPSAKKHVQNLNNQRAFRQRKENYIRTLENKALNLEMLYSSAQNEIEALKEKVAMLEKKLASTRSTKNGGIVGSAMYQAIIDNQSSTYAADEQKGKNDVIMNDFTTSSGRNLSPYVPVTITSAQLNQLKENDLSLSVQLSSKRKFSSDSHTSSIESDDIIQDSLFCEPNSIASMDKYTGERIYIASPTSLYSTLVGDSSQNTRDNRPTFPESQWQGHPYFEAPTNIATTVGSFTPTHHPLNLKWILTQNEE